MTSSTSTPIRSIADIKALIHRESRRVTSYDVAVCAGVSQSAVSRCFKPGASVSKATYARVMKAAQELDYIPNAAARSLITKRSNLVAVVLSELVTLYYPDVLSELSRQFTARGVRLVLFTLSKEADVARTMADVWQYQVDGALVAARLSESQVAEFERRGVPLVLFNRQLRGKNVNAIICDQVEAARVMVSRLAAAGHQRFAIVDGPNDSAIAQDRRKGVSERLAELGLPEPLVVSGNYDYASGADGLRRIHALMQGFPDAVICGNDVMAIGCLDTARHEFKLDVPGQLSVTGFDGIAPANWLSYQLTTLRQPIASMAHAAADMLTGLIRTGNSGPERRVFSASFVEGRTATFGPAY
ncbi:MAG: LacI family DNA-binding transcriptional regulator [Pseudomonadota bacterium]